MRKRLVESKEPSKLSPNPVLVDLLGESRDVKRGRIFLVMMSQLAYNFIYTAITKGFSEEGRFKLPDIVTANRDFI